MSRQAGAKLKYKEKTPPRREFADMVLPRPEGSSPSHAKVTKTDPTESDEATVKLAIAEPKKEKSKRPTIKDADTVLTKPLPKSVRIQQALEKKQTRSKNNVTAIALALSLALILATFFLIPSVRQKFMPEDSQSSALDRDGLEQFVNFHRHETGTKLNRERLGVEIENAITAPPLGYDTKKVPAPNMLNGLPLVGESYGPSVESPNARREPMNPDFPDARMMYNLQEQQDENEWERRAQKQYVDEFVANAQRAGYKIKIDKYGHVTVMGRGPAARLPREDEDGDQAPAFPGAVR